tara:strand:- start:37274 stop:38623 length:1350 start_codon:yes stop_codon:yes gene_type:complete
MPTDITVSVNDERFIVPRQETSSDFVAGFLSKVPENELIRALGSTGERQQGFLVVPELSDWFARLNNPLGTDMLTDGHDAYSGSENGAAAGARLNGTNPRWPDGPTGSWEREWYAVHNYLKYGGSAVVAGTGSVQNTVSPKNTLADYTDQLDIIFAATGGVLANTDISFVANTREDVIGILGAGFSGDVIPSLLYNGLTGFSGPGITHSKYTFSVPGTKFHLKTSRNIQTETDFDLLQESFLAPDIAGCFARTMVEGRSFKSPAGMERGKILDVVRIGKVISDNEYDLLYNAGINPVRTFPEGSFLFGDKSGESVPGGVNTEGGDIATPPMGGEVNKTGVKVFSRINVVRTFLFLKNVLGESARRFLFEINDGSTRQAFISTITPILRSVEAGRGISEFSVVCDESNNTQAVIDANEFVADVFIKPIKSINFIRLRFTNKDNNQELITE